MTGLQIAKKQLLAFFRFFIVSNILINFNRLTATVLLFGLVSPTFNFGVYGKVKPQSLPSFSSATNESPTSPAPQVFLINNRNTFKDLLSAGFANLVTFSSETITNLFDKKSMPDGLELPDNYPSVENSVSENPTSENALSNLLLAQPSGSVDFDFDGDGKADLARWHPGTTEWKIKNSSSGTFTTHTIGNSTSIIAPGRFDNDSKTDVAVFNAGTWTIKKSTDGTSYTVSFGTNGDKPVVGDYDGDGYSDIALYRPSTNVWWILQSSNNQTVSMSFGLAGDIPAQGNFDGDSKTDIAVYRPSTGVWHISGSEVGYFNVQWGLAADIPVPADFDGDGKTDLSVYRGATGTWYVLHSSDNGATFTTKVWGNYGDQPVPADYDNDGKADYSIWRPTTGVWHTIKSNSGNPQYDYQTLGQTGDTAVSSAYLKQIGGAVVGYDLAKARLSPKNETGGTDLYSQNFGWGTGLVGLSGRSGMGAGFGLSYNSLIWTKEPTSNTVYFDADNSNVSPGFRFGFPTIEPIYWDKYAERFSYLMVTPSGARVEFRQVNGASDTYETAESSYLQLKTVGATNPGDPVENFYITIQGTDGSKMTYLWKAGAFRCSEIKDRNGNYISINHDDQGLLRTVTDTLGRVIAVNYDTQLYPTSITQTWKDDNGAGSDVTYTWASFTYTTATVSTSFASGINVVGPANDTTLKVLQKVTFPNGGYTTFEYNGYAQVKKVNNYAADNHLLSYAKTNLDNPSSNQTDCPRFTETRSWVENFNQDTNGTAQEVVINNSITPNSSYSLPGNISGSATKIEVSMTNNPYGAISKTFVGSSGWMEGLPIATEDWANGTSGSERKRWTWTDWTQDDTNLTEILNPRVVESRVGDTSNIKKSKTYYKIKSGTSTVADYGLVEKVEVFDSDLSTVLKKVETDYSWNTAYTSRRIIGLPGEVRGYGFENSSLALVSKMTYQYDEGDFTDSSLEQNLSNAIQHDDTNYGSSFITGRGNLTSTTRVDVTSQTSSVTSSVKYNTTGAPVAQIDPLGRTVKIGYSDNFNDTTTSRNTFAYPTKLTEVANTDTTNNYSEVKYRFDNGANVWAKSPKPVNNTTGKETTRLYDSIGRLQKETIVNTGAYTRYEYPTSFVQSKVYSTIIDTNNNGADSNDEVYSESWTDGAGRVRKSRTEHPNSTGGWTGSLVEYDILGQVTRSTVPTEINASYEPAGDDYTRGWLWNSQEYDWKGRITRSIPSDSNGSDGKDQLISYEGCGCAGGQVTTIQGELVPRDDQPNTNARRTQKIYADILGRTYKTELLNWDGNVYKTLLNTYNGRDQVVSSKEIAGVVTSNDYRETTMVYDGHGRLSSQHHPEQDANTATTYTYFDDDKPSTITDARGAVKHYSYNSRGLIYQKWWTVPQNSQIEVPATVTYSYDALGSRASMTDGFGTVDYEYNQLSQLTAETREFNETIPQTPIPNDNSFRIEYTYGLAGQLTSYKEPFGEIISYGFDKTGKPKTVSGNRTVENIQFNYITDAKYRAWGATKEVNYGNNINMNLSFNNRLQAQQYDFGSSGQNSSTTEFQYDYYSDGRLKFSSYGVNSGSNFDRSYQYDFLGRLKSSKTGAEARGQTETNANNRPYRTTLSYNQYGDIVTQERLHWTASFNYTFQYQNGRVSNETINTNIPGWNVGTTSITPSFDNDGRRLDTLQQTFDADGRINQNSSSNRENDPSGHGDYRIEWDYTSYDYSGDGQMLKLVKDGNLFHGTTQTYSEPIQKKRFYIASSILGENIVEIEENSDAYFAFYPQRRNLVYAGGQEIAERGVKNIGESLSFTDKTIVKSTDPSGVEHTTALLRNDSNTPYQVDVGETVTVDLFGAYIGYSNEYPVPPPIGYPDPNDPNCEWNDYDDYECSYPDDYDDPVSEENQAGSVPENTCYENGFERNCNEANHLLENGDVRWFNFSRVKTLGKMRV